MARQKTLPEPSKALQNFGIQAWNPSLSVVTRRINGIERDEKVIQSRLFESQHAFRCELASVRDKRGPKAETGSRTNDVFQVLPKSWLASSEVHKAAAVCVDLS